MPIDAAIPDLLAALAARRMAVLQAPPGAGKTTRVPLALMEAGLTQGRILMLEPRRLAARGAAERMAQTLGEPVGETVGYRMRGEAKTSSRTRIEVVTEGILTRMIQSDPGLEGIGAVIFDEFHERSLHADLGLALALEVRGALREDLILLAMSATLEAAPVADLMADPMGRAPLITSEGRAFAVETRWLLRPLPARARLEAEMAALILQALDEVPEGGVLAFLPGEAEIRRCEAALSGRLPPGCTLRPLYGAMDFSAQRAALAPVAAGRKIVLATAIAETSLTIPDIRVVVDAGRARRARFDPNTGMSRLVTERVTRAEAEQRRGRAGRVAEGVCYRLWTRGEEGALAPFPPAEIESADLTPLALELALWGGADGLNFLTAPNPGAMAEAQALLSALGALEAGRITDHGRALAALPLHPRLGHMLLTAGGGERATTLAAILSERDPIRGAPPDLALRLKAVGNAKGFEADHPFTVDRGVADRIRTEAKRLARQVRAIDPQDLSIGQLAALAYPDRIGLRRKGDAPRFLLSGGKGAVMEEGTPLAGQRLIVATDLDGDRSEARIRQAAPITEAELRALYAAQIRWQDRCEWDRRESRILMRRQERFGALVLDDRIWPDPPPEAIAQAAFEGLRLTGLTWTPAAARLRARVALCRRDGADLPDLSDDALLGSDGAWLLPYLAKVRTLADLRALDLTEPLRALLGWEALQMLDRLTPSHFETPLGRRIPIDYSGDYPGVELRLQELFGTTTHPTVGPKSLPLRLTLLSPGGKPVQVTLDLPGFWTSSYGDVRRDMRGRYPRHPWPEDPRAADPTLRAKPRGT
ncbi:ATP-dependent helicase HrpB [Tabrizicola sp. DMG-N-6]|uniref:ATP-dependent helicase HrpB n=1 Tax=Szabonella alba TaxID=2804194 RepID=A0A8K0XZJ7_9RHOB|nr:ATP-dependent helicase HrpB [Szabonella alba]MBL4916128.1 ATP-dependent helicase HrpB [Szabonella alba]